MTDTNLAALCQRLRPRAKALGVRSEQDWRSLWRRVRTRYGAALETKLEEIADVVGVHRATLAESMRTLLSGLEPATLHAGGDGNGRVTLVILAASVPALAAQSVFPLLAGGSTVILKPSRREPHTAALLQSAIRDVDPGLGDLIAVLPDLRLDDDGTLPEHGPDRVVAYGADGTIERITAAFGHPRTPTTPLGHGWSAVYCEDAGSGSLAAVARDVALFDQRGCLCPQVVITPQPAPELVAGLGAALTTIADVLPPSPESWPLAAMRQLRDAAIAAGRAVADQPLETGLVFEAEPATGLMGTPGGRSVRVYGDCSLPDAVVKLQPAAHELQSIAFATPDDLARRVRSALGSLGVRVVEAGQLHAPGFDWVANQLGGAMG